MPVIERDVEVIRRVEAGSSVGGTEILMLDDEASTDVSTVVKETGKARGAILLDAIKTGIQGVYNRLMREKVIAAQKRDSAESEAILDALERSDLLDDPLSSRCLRNVNLVAMRNAGKA